MRDKERILSQLSNELHMGLVTEADIRALFAPSASETTHLDAHKHKERHDKLSAVDIMFYIAGLILFATIMSSIVQTWSGGSVFTHIGLSAGAGALLWFLAGVLVKSSHQSDVRRGMENSLLLTGSLLLITGGYIVTNEIIGGFNEVNLIPGSITLIILSALHIGFDRLVNRNFILLMGILLGTAAFPTLLVGILEAPGISTDVWSIILIATSALLAYSTRVVARINPSRQEIKTSFDSLATFMALSSMYAASFGSYGLLWLGIMIAAIFSAFYLSIISRNKRLLGNGSFFLVLAVITVSFKYFSGFGATLSLVMATIGMLGSAAVAAGINKKYFNKSTTQPTN